METSPCIKQGDIFERNMACLKSNNPYLIINTDKLSDSNIELVTGPRGQLSIKRNGVYIHSLYDPQDEAKKLLENLNIQEMDMIIIFGFGLGYLLKEVFHVFPGKIIIIEPDEHILSISMQLVDFTDQINSKRIFFLSNVEQLDALLWGNYSLGDRFRVIIIPFYANMYSTELKELSIRLECLKNEIDQSGSALIQRSKTWCAHTWLNLEHILKYPDTSVLLNTLESIPAVVVGAGPSLDKNIDLLYSIKDHVIILCAGTALKALLAKKIIPDLVLAIESKNISAQFENCPELMETSKVIASFAHPHLFTLKSKSTFVLNTVGNDTVTWIYNQLGRSMKVVEGPSVACCAFTLAHQMSANPIILVGQDLAYTEGNTYATGTIRANLNFRYDDHNKTISYKNVRSLNNNTDQMHFSHNEKAFLVPGYFGDNVVTNYHFFSFISWYQRFIKQNAGTNTLFINATEGGAYLEGMEHIRLSDVIPQLPKINCSVKEKFHTIYNQYDSLNMVNMHQPLQKLVKILQKLIIMVSENVRMLNKLKKKCSFYSQPDSSYISCMKRFNYNEKKIIKSINELGFLGSYFSRENLFARSIARKTNQHGNQDTALSYNLKQTRKYYRSILMGMKSLKKLVFSHLTVPSSTNKRSD